MPIRRPFPVSALVLALAAASCSEPNAPAMNPLASLDQGAPSHHVLGSGHVAQGGGLREFTFHVVDGPDGTAGSFKIVLPSGLFFEADATCFAVDGNIGWVGGVIRATNAGIVVVGSVSTFYAIDGGEGDGANDVVSVATFNGAAGADVAFCANRPLALAPLAVTSGNVQVR
jgi:hypothetical protein